MTPISSKSHHQSNTDQLDTISSNKKNVGIKSSTNIKEDKSLKKPSQSREENNNTKKEKDKTTNKKKRKNKNKDKKRNKNKSKHQNQKRKKARHKN